MQRQAGFTLVEIAIAVFIMLILLFIAIPSLTGVMANQRLQRSLDAVKKMVGEAQDRSVEERRPYLIVWEKDDIALRPEELAKGEDEGPIDFYSIQRGDSLHLKLPAALQKDPPPQWIFWPSGNCEPAIVSFSGSDGSWSAKFSALTTQPEILSYAAR